MVEEVETGKAGETIGVCLAEVVAEEMVEI